MYKGAVIHFPNDERTMQFIDREIAAFHCAAAVKFMDTLQLDCHQQAAVIDALLCDMQQDIPTESVSENN